MLAESGNVITISDVPDVSNDVTPEKLKISSCTVRSQLQTKMCVYLSTCLQDLVDSYCKNDGLIKFTDNDYHSFIIETILGDKYARWYKGKCEEGLTVDDFKMRYCSNFVTTLEELLGCESFDAFMKQYVADFLIYFEHGSGLNVETMQEKNPISIGDYVRESVKMVRASDSCSDTI